MSDQEIDELLARAARNSQAPDPALVESIADSIKHSTEPVRPLPHAWLLSAATVLVSIAIAIGGAGRLGFFGFEKLGIVDRVLIFSVLSVFIWAAAREFASQMIPGSRHRLVPGVLLPVAVAAILGVFALLFHDYRTTNFVSAGIACLSAGVLHAIAAALLSWLVLRRGFAVNMVRAGLTAGILGGLAGVAMLELHCPNSEALHIIVWHTAVVPVSGAAGAFIAWLILRVQ